MSGLGLGLGLGGRIYIPSLAGGRGWMGWGLGCMRIRIRIRIRAFRGVAPKSTRIYIGMSRLEFRGASAGGDGG